MFSFIDGVHHPIWILSWLILAGVVFFYTQKHRPKENFIEIELLKRIYKKQTIWYPMYIACIWSITALFFIILADPYLSSSVEKEKKNGIDIEIVVDLSYSMIATDIAPNRLEVAKQVLSSFIGKVEQDRVWLILFAWKPFQSIPLSYDYEFLKEFLSNLSVDTINQQYQRLQGTAIGDALVLASGVLEKHSAEREKVIILITDGEANKGVDPSLALKLLKEKDIKTYTVWVGKAEETSIDLPLFWGLSQKVLIGGVDEEILKKIAKETWGLYFKADSPHTFQDIFDTIAKLEKKELEIETYVLHRSLAGFLSSILGLLLFVLLSIIWFKKIRW